MTWLFPPPFYENITLLNIPVSLNFIAFSIPHTPLILILVCIHKQILNTNTTQIQLYPIPFHTLQYLIITLANMAIPSTTPISLKINK